MKPGLKSLSLAVVSALFITATVNAEIVDGIGKDFKHPPMNKGAAPASKPAAPAIPMQPEGPVLQGKVEEVTSGAGYSYLLLNAGGVKFWVAGTQVTAKVGDVVSYIENVTMENFTSRTLNRTFDKIVFASMVKVVK